MKSIEPWEHKTVLQADFDKMQRAGVCPNCTKRKNCQEFIPGLDACGCSKCKAWFAPVH